MCLAPYANRVISRTASSFVRFGVRVAGASVLTVGRWSCRRAPRPRTRSTWHRSSFKPTRGGWNLSISTSPSGSTRYPTWPARTPGRFRQPLGHRTAQGGESPITDSLFIAGYQLGCQTDVSSGLGWVVRAQAVATPESSSLGQPRGSVGQRRGCRRWGGLRPDHDPARGHRRGADDEHGPVAHGRAMLDLTTSTSRQTRVGVTSASDRTPTCASQPTDPSGFAIYGDPSRFKNRR